ncbi:hypothetical protein HDU97_004879 [Phlyctochytrium planicorne]|nr:hypothetical protein HDU97_004879 [Phlyctochytrium planicorne]
MGVYEGFGDSWSRVDGDSSSDKSQGTPKGPASNLEILAHSIPTSPPKRSHNSNIKSNTSPDLTPSHHHRQSPDSTKRPREDETTATAGGGESSEEGGSMDAMDVDDPEKLQQYKKHKRLSINTTLHDAHVQRQGGGGGATAGTGTAQSSSGGSGSTASKESGGYGTAGAPATSSTPVTRDVYEKTLMVRQQQKALIEARNLKQAKPASQLQSAHVHPSGSLNDGGAPASAPVSGMGSTSDSKLPSLPARRNSFRNLKIMTPSTDGSTGGAAAVAAAATTSSSSAAGSAAPPRTGPQDSSSHSHHPSNLSHPNIPPNSTPPQHHAPPPSSSHHPSSNTNSNNNSSLPSPRLPPPNNPKMPQRYLNHQSQATAPSPRSEFPSRDLPLPYDNAPPRSPHPLYAKPVPKSPQSAYPGNAPPGFGDRGTGQGFGGIPKTSFVGAFESLYDAAEEIPRLSTALREQVRKSSSLLQTLQASGAMIEGLVKGLFREMQVQYGEKFGAALADLNRRLLVIEEMNGIQPAAAVPGGQGEVNGNPALNNNGFRGSGPPTPYVGAGGGASGLAKSFASNEAIFKQLMDRIEALEKKAEI